MHSLRIDAPIALPTIVVVAGRSMEPGLQPGSRLRVVPLEGAPHSGDVVVMRSAGGTNLLGLVVHRIVATSASGGVHVVFHRGDAGGRVGVAPVDCVLGRVVTVVGRPVPAVRDLEPGQRHAFLRARRRARVYAYLRDTGLRRAPAARALAVLARRVLLGA
jgi:signal peptidase I